MSRGGGRPLARGREDSFNLEVIDSITGEVLTEGEQGELVFTSLAKRGDAGHAQRAPRSGRP